MEEEGLEGWKRIRLVSISALARQRSTQCAGAGPQLAEHRERWEQQAELWIQHGARGSWWAGGVCTEQYPATGELGMGKMRWCVSFSGRAPLGLSSPHSSHLEALIPLLGEATFRQEGCMEPV